MKKITLTICLLVMLASCNQQQTNKNNSPSNDASKKENPISSNINVNSETIEFLEYYIAENFRLDMVAQNIAITKSDKAQYLGFEDKENFTVLHFKSKNASGQFTDDYATLIKSGLIFLEKPKTLKEINLELNENENLNLSMSNDDKIELIRKYLQKIETFDTRDITVTYTDSTEENDYIILNYVLRNNRYDRFKNDFERSASSDSIDYNLLTDRQIFVSKDLNYIFSTWSGPKTVEDLKLEIEEKETRQQTSENMEWQTYQNNKYGIEFKCPKYIQFNSEGENSNGWYTNYDNLGDNYFSFAALDKAEGMENINSLKYRDKNLFAPNELNFQNGKFIMVDGYGTANYYFVDTYYEGKDYVYHFMMSRPEYSKEMFELFEKILTTVKLTK